MARDYYAVWGSPTNRGIESMDSLDLATKLLRGGMGMRDAAQVLVIMSGTFKFGWPLALVQLEEVAQTIDEEELWVPQPWLNELRYLRKRVKELDQ